MNAATLKCLDATKRLADLKRDRIERIACLAQRLVGRGWRYLIFFSEPLEHLDHVCGTAVEITPIRSVDKIPVGRGSRGPVTTAIQQAFFDYINGAVPDRHNWLQPVQIPAPDREHATTARSQY